MGQRRARIEPAWTLTLGAGLDQRNVEFRARCRGCKGYRSINLTALIRTVGRDYSLWHRRSKCRITLGCEGWNVFEYSTGTWWWHMYDEADEDRWMAIDGRL